MTRTIEAKADLSLYLREIALEVPHDTPVHPLADVLVCGDELAAFASWTGTPVILRPIAGGGLAMCAPYWWAHTIARLLPLLGVPIRVGWLPPEQDSGIPEYIRFGMVRLRPTVIALDLNWKHANEDFRRVMVAAGEDPVFRDGMLATLNLMLAGAPENLNATAFEREESPGVWVPTQRSDAQNTAGESVPVRSTTPGQRIWQSLLRELGVAR